VSLKKDPVGNVNVSETTKKKIKMSASMAQGGRKSMGTSLVNNSE
jgi:hypothetical protein